MWQPLALAAQDATLENRVPFELSTMGDVAVPAPFCDFSKCKTGWKDCATYHLPMNPASFKQCPTQLPGDMKKVWEWILTVGTDRPKDMAEFKEHMGAFNWKACAQDKDIGAYFLCPGPQCFVYCIAPARIKSQIDGSSVRADRASAR